ncbi:polyisoprenoid-binding protein YceI [Rhodococcus sp. SMB37]|uniref:YceI family protein n=1 Tax=Rhodococcus sp. SMB37 TaxID=2512213 RepID=UPI0006D27F12|nr:YceI family protein [Rhodococcus sp. SMB37]TCN50133.1 polyisoprenoid-binding protein YceI [Rhodococcus sp. SMB37]
MTASTTTLPGLTAGTWAIDPVHSSVGFSVRHLMVSKVRGTFENFSGSIVVAEDGTATATAEIQVDSINTKNADRDAHIKSADFFDAANYPVASFATTGVRAEGGDYVLAGDFTLHGVTRPIELTLEFNGVNPGMGQGAVAGFEATTVINRKDFGITIEMPLEGGGAVVGDKITLNIEIEAIQQA